MRLFILLALTITVLPIAARAQQTTPTPSLAAAVACRGGTGAVITSVSTTPTTVCAAPGPGGKRTFFQIIGLPPWSGIAYCTIDGRVPSATNTIFIVSAGQGFDSKGPLPISSGPIPCS